jgi:outer membrane autotransporter protein
MACRYSRRTAPEKLAALAAVCLAAMLAPANAQTAPTYQAFDLFTRGSTVYDSVSLGAFYANNEEIDFTGRSIFGDYSGSILGLNSILQPLTPSGTATISYPSGTGGLSQLPFVLSYTLPQINVFTGQNTEAVVPVLYNFDGANGLSLSFTYNGTSVRLDGGIVSPDPLGLGDDDVTVNGVITAGNNSPDTITLAVVIRIGVTVGTPEGTGIYTFRSSGMALESLQPIGQGFTLNATFNGVSTPITVPVVLYNASGPGSVIIADTDGGGSIIFSADQLYTGGTTINSGAKLQLGNGGVGGSVAGDIVDNGALVFNRSDHVVYSGVVSGPGTLTQEGTGTLILTGQNSYSGGTVIDPGSNLEIAPGAQIGSGSLYNAGNLILPAPFALPGNYTQTGTLTLDASSNEGGGRLFAAHPVSLANQQLAFNAVNGYMPAGPYLLVSAPGNGTSYANDRITVTVPGHHVLSNLQMVNAGANIDLLLLFQADPTIYADTLMEQRQSFLRVSDAVDTQQDVILGAPAASGGNTVSARGMTLWLSAMGDATHTSHGNGAAGYDSSGGGAVIGLDRLVTPDTHAGMVLAVDNEVINGGNGTSYNGQSGQFRIYAATQQGAEFADVQFGGIITQGTAKRSVFASPEAQARLSGSAFGASMRVGGRYALAGWAVEPSVTLGGLTLGQGTTDESGAGPADLQISRGSLNSVYTLAALESDRAFTLGQNYALAAAARVGWMHELAASSAVLNAASADGPAAFGSAPLGRESADLSLQAELQTPSAWRLFARYQASVSGYANSQAVEGGGKLIW